MNIKFNNSQHTMIQGKNVSLHITAHIAMKQLYRQNYKQMNNLVNIITNTRVMLFNQAYCTLTAGVVTEA